MEKEISNVKIFTPDESFCYSVGFPLPKHGIDDEDFQLPKITKIEREIRWFVFYSGEEKLAEFVNPQSYMIEYK